MESKKKCCAFCGVQKKLSREHVFPNGVIRKLEEGMLSLNDKSDKVFKADLVVKDVCEPCNNGILSEIDGRFVKLFEDNMLQPIQPGDNVEFEFNYNDLLRELLKISYNSARASADGFKAVAALRKYVPYILGKVNDAPDVMLRLLIVTSSNRLNTETNQIEGTMEARLLRSCKVSYNGPQHSNFMIRLLAFNSFWFYLIIPLKPVSSSKIEVFINGFMDSYHLTGIPICKTMKSVSIPKEKTTYMHPSLIEGMSRKRA
ncbi:MULTISPECIES: hypothetical protein [Shewanella]|jgi:hypothetical protein|uniref:HNH endonuclease n=1 Tax=Shewanella ulleungensis TaxID=2282699 RepID=A0ABQ2QFD2_9GAMM|nr:MULTISPECIES: hypothetical protein [Shewanella]MCL1148634.1 hypothetical protein [Shewanella ulleungensis]PKG79019.1 hypothetical protein CXF80_12245 [Shewanella sp. Actino-trap-3]GGP76602.1 hypothetical protein GCM10009410_06320 [Shewanella ulleungensis]